MKWQPGYRKTKEIHERRISKTTLLYWRVLWVIRAESAAEKAYLNFTCDFRAVRINPTWQADSRREPHMIKVIAKSVSSNGGVCCGSSRVRHEDYHVVANHADCSYDTEDHRRITYSTRFHLAQPFL